MWVQLVRCACGGRYYDRPSYGYDRCPLASLALVQKQCGSSMGGCYGDPHSVTACDKFQIIC